LSIEAVMQGRAAAVEESTLTCGLYGMIRSVMCRLLGTRAAKFFLDEHPDRARRGLLVCRCPEPQQLTDRVLALPWDRL
jgi:hypothetical protein